MRDNNRGLENKLAIVISKLKAHEIPILNLTLDETEVFEIPDTLLELEVDICGVDLCVSSASSSNIQDGEVVSAPSDPAIASRIALLANQQY